MNEQNDTSPPTDFRIDEANTDGSTSEVFQNYSEILPSQFVDEVVYPYVLCTYGHEGEELLDKLPEELDLKLRMAVHDYFSALDQLSLPGMVVRK